MKDDLIKVLNFKLKHVTDNIDELNNFNSKIDEENANLQYIKNAINGFKGEERGFDIYKFSKLDRETFNKLLMELSDDVLVKFGTSSCNYDGLIYLINGINNGISLSLTQEQVDAINLLIDKLLEKEKEYHDKIEILNTDKQKLEIKDLEVLNKLQNKYSTIVDEFENKKYVTSIDEIIEAIAYSELSNEKTFDLLCYLLKYNSSIYEEEKDRKVSVPVKENTIDLTVPFTQYIEEEKDEDVEVTIANEEVVEKPKLDENSVEIRLSEANEEDDLDKTMTLPDFSYLHKEPMAEPAIIPSVSEKVVSMEAIPAKEVEIVNEVPKNQEEVSVVLPVVEVDEDFSDLTSEDFEDYNPVLPNFEDSSSLEIDLNSVPSTVTEVVNPVVEEVTTAVKAVEDSVTLVNEIKETPKVEVKEEVVEEKITPEEKTESLTTVVEEVAVKLNEEDVKKVFDEYSLKYELIDDVTKTLLLKGDLDSYKNVLAKLKELGVLGIFKDNLETLVQIVLYSTVEIIDEIVGIIGTSLSVDEDDKKITTNIVFKTMPSVFVKNENGNYDNFIKNIQSFKEYGIDLINLFDFSKEVYVADHDYLVNNYNTVRTYDLTVNDRNAKYFLLLPNISTRLDYYVESIYKDTMKGSHGDIFDGLDLIKLYPSKLNIVTDETIKRLRYSSENGKKIFGSKEKSLSGEITNLKVDVLNIPDEYLRTFFNNEFDIITRDEVAQYEKLVMNNNYVAPSVDDMLNKLESLRQGIRYVVEGVNVSRNKVIRNYNILVSNNVNKTKALLFAICHNLVVTKAEYEKIKTFVNSLGGN